ncbi:hypothetical protein HY612_04275 [Candidatus Roizmanbacteria bacterium]|nr:hypothetical protein [Candidatus Roizmanbacteria bacterium]
MSKIIVITGQTATGKTSLALDYAKKYNAELINCDSRQIYKHLDIITGKDLTDKKIHRVSRLGNFDIGYYQISDRTPEIEEADVTSAGKTSGVKAKIWLYDIINPDQYFSSFDYQQCALWVIKKILREGKTPIIVGGTAFYLKHLLYGVDTENIPPNWLLRKKLQNKSVEELQDILTMHSTQLINQLSRSELNNPQRLIRKIEIAIHRRDGINRVSTKNQQFWVETGHAPSLPSRLHIQNLKVHFIGLKFKNKNKLRSAIKKRVEKRLKQGAIEEVKKLLIKGYEESDPGLKTIGYQQLILHLKGVLDAGTAIQDWINKEVQYAKRQYTFMKKDKNIIWQDV